MRRLMGRAVRRFIRAVGRANAERAIVEVARLSEIDLISLAHRRAGIMKYQDDFVSGERFLISRVLPPLIDSNRPVLFDVGANVGRYSLALHGTFPHARVWAFEPNPETFAALRRNTEAAGVCCNNLGLGADAGRRSIYYPAESRTSEHASPYKEVLLDLHGKADLVEREFDQTTLDLFCAEHGIDTIDFLKVDTEGHELAVLRGGHRLISEGRVRLIQFEFNEMNVVSRVFLRDFYEILRGYVIFRLDTERLVPLRDYSPRNEVFQFQNLVAVQSCVVGRTERFLGA